MTFDELRDDFLRIVSEVVWCTVRGHARPAAHPDPHPYWEVADGAPVGWVGTSRSPLRTRHVTANPHVSCAYWSPWWLMLLTAEDVAAGNSYQRVWRAGEG
jgi:hypothetical protein